MVCHCLLIETEEGLVLVDTGLGQHDIDEPIRRLGKSWLRLTAPLLDPNETAIHQVRAAGFDPRDVRHIVLTHLDCDHIGGISDFPEATIHVSQTSLASITPGLVPELRNRLNPPQWEHDPIWSGIEGTSEDWFGMGSLPAIAGVPALADDIRMVPLPGHLIGHVGIAVRRNVAAGPEWLLNAGDAIFHGNSLTAQRVPRGLAAFEKKIRVDATSWAISQRQLRDLHDRYSDQVTIFAAHDPKAFDALATQNTSTSQASELAVR